MVEHNFIYFKIPKIQGHSDQASGRKRCWKIEPPDAQTRVQLLVATQGGQTCRYHDRPQAHSCAGKNFASFELKSYSNC